MVNNLLSDYDYTIILQNRFKTTDVKYISAELKPISENVEGFLGEHHNLHITYQLNNKIETETFFLKSKPTKNKVQSDFTEEMGAYKKEIFVYDYLLKEFQAYGYDTSFAATSYHCIPNKALVLENLGQRGFQLTERNKSFTIPQIKCTLNALALFHAAGFAYEKTKSKELNVKYSIAEQYSDVLEEIWFVFVTDKPGFSAKWSPGAFKTIYTLTELLPRDDSFKNKLKSLVKNYKFAQGFVEKTNFAKTCGHGDLWSNNLLFKNETQNPMQCCLLDFQVFRYLYPCFDVLLAIFCNTNPSFRKQHLQELYQYYYKTLQTSLNRYKCNIENIMSIEDFHKSIKLMLPDALFQVLNTVLVTNLPKDLLNSFVHDNPNGMTELIFDNANLCADAFQTNEKYRSMVIEIYDEYYDIMLDCNKC